MELQQQENDEIIRGRQQIHRINLITDVNLSSDMKSTAESIWVAVAVGAVGAAAAVAGAVSGAAIVSAVQSTRDRYYLLVSELLIAIG